MKKIALILIFIIVFSLFIGCISDDTNDVEDYIDSDNDGKYDHVDAFPNDPSASVDTDNDGYPDCWNEGKSEDDSTNNLIIDKFPNDIAASMDSDNDGYPDKWNEGKSKKDSTTIPPLDLDEYPYDLNAHKDTDKDGVADYYDKNDYVNLSLELKLDSFQVIKRVDFFRWAHIYFEVKIDEYFETVADNLGFWWVGLNKKKNIHQIIKYDIPDTINKDDIKIEISMYDYDFLKTNEQLDINKENDKKSFTLTFNLVENKAEYYNNAYEGPDGIIWIEINHPPMIKPEGVYIHKKYNWRYENNNFSLNLNFSNEKYEYYLNNQINRVPQNNPINPFGKMASFVTYNDDAIQDLSVKLNELANIQGYNLEQKANFILRFVQTNIGYFEDDDSKGCVEYWRFPIETLVEQKGDCEDTSTLYAAILKNLKYDIALLFYSWKEDDENIGHLAVGINIPGDYGDYVTDENDVKYFYCETTSKNFNVGEIPDEPIQIKEGPTEIISI
jgi:hypothetical protein